MVTGSGGVVKQTCGDVLQDLTFVQDHQTRYISISPLKKSCELWQIVTGNGDDKAGDIFCALTFLQDNQT